MRMSATTTMSVVAVLVLEAACLFTVERLVSPCDTMACKATDDTSCCTLSAVLAADDVDGVDRVAVVLVTPCILDADDDLAACMDEHSSSSD